MLEKGEIVAGYEVVAPLGRGAMAQVFRVRPRAGGPDVALKVIDAPGAHHRARVRREAEALLGLEHPNVVRTLGAVDVAGRPGLLLELVEGPSLDVRLAKPMGWDEVRTIFEGVCAGVAAAHRMGLVHRDLKPANVLVAYAGARPIAKVADFGIVKSEEHGAGVTQSNVALGTLGYMAPEQIADAKRVDVRADVYSLGCLLYRMVVGRAPFSGDLLSVHAAAAAGRYTPPERVVAGAPDDLIRVIHACLRPERDDRPADVAAVLALLGGAPAGAARPAPPSPATISAGTFELGDVGTLAPQAATPSAPPPPAGPPGAGWVGLPASVWFVVAFAAVAGVLVLLGVVG